MIDDKQSSSRDTSVVIAVTAIALLIVLYLSSAEILQSFKGPWNGPLAIGVTLLAFTLAIAAVVSVAVDRESRRRR